MTSPNKSLFDFNAIDTYTYTHTHAHISHLESQPLLEMVSTSLLLLARLESAYSLIWGSHKIWGKGGGDTLDLL